MTASVPPVEDPHRTERIRTRDPDTLQAVVRENLPILLRAARAAGLPPDRAEDTVQEVLLTFLTRAAEFDGRARVRTWLYGILLKKMSRALEGVRRAQETEEIDAVVESRFDQAGRWSRPPRGPDAGADRERVRAWLAQCLEELPDRRRIAFVLREVEELPTEEVCKVLEVTPNNLGVLLFRARNGLRECLETRGLRGRHDADL
ncbi:MAG TPA: sigma-70 family RNA polymerase sigma factor [Gemmatimonadales bacterium]|nr:sigma-70 family RNA polymerase sigma factor [Gemmatimonadales bacterium]